MDLTSSEVIVLEHCRVSPPSGSLAKKSLPLTFFDLPYTNYYLPPCLFFYETHLSNTDFLESIVPKLKHSLSLALKHFFPFAGNLILYPSGTTTIKPQIRYEDGDSVSLTIATCTNDFNYLTGIINPRNVGDFYPLTPQMPNVTNVSDTIRVPLFAVKVTHFPNNGICIGVIRDHVIGDSSTIVSFLNAWGLITKLGSDETLLTSGSLPFYDRTVIKDPKGLYEIYRRENENAINDPLGYRTRHLFPSPNNIVRTTYIVGQVDIQRLKEKVLARRTKLAHVSSFVVVCAYMWSCMAKFRVATGEEVFEDDLEYFVFMANCRPRLHPDVPETYFGNCIAPCLAMAKSVLLIGEEAFLTAVDSIKEAINQRVNNDEGVLKRLETWFLMRESVRGKKVLGISGTPNFSLTHVDFGWGNPKRMEYTYGSCHMSLDRCNTEKGGLEIGLSFPKDQADLFASIFLKGLK